jgi:hypothetical protein
LSSTVFHRPTGDGWAAPRGKTGKTRIKIKKRRQTVSLRRIVKLGDRAFITGKSFLPVAEAIFDTLEETGPGDTEKPRRENSAKVGIVAVSWLRL